MSQPVKPVVVDEVPALQPLKPVLEIYTDKVKLRITDCPVPLVSSILQQVLNAAEPKERK
jgi:hypothetical protein